MIKNVFLDFNGTLIDDVDLCLKLLNDILRRQGAKEVSLEERLSTAEAVIAEILGGEV